MSVHKIEDCTSVLYNIKFMDMDADDKCMSLVCGDEKCICMDEEQAGLLRKLLSEEDQIAMSYTGERFVFQNLQSKLFEEGICQQSLLDKNVYGNVLFRDRHFSKAGEIICEIIKEYYLGLLERGRYSDR